MSEEPTMRNPVVLPPNVDYDSREGIRRRVAAGARLLDEEQPGWEDLIHPGKLNLPSCADCILGQVYGLGVPGPDGPVIADAIKEFGQLCYQLGLYSTPPGDEADSYAEEHLSAQYGFDAVVDEYPQLQEAWLREVRIRKQGHAE